MNGIIIRKDGSASIANADGRGVDVEAVRGLVGEHINLRNEGWHTGEVSSGARLDGLVAAMALGFSEHELSDKMLAMAGLASHFGKWQICARERGLLAVSSLSTEIELEDAEEGKQIRGGLGEAIGHLKVLLVGNYHDEASQREMNLLEKEQAEKGNLYRTESEENDFHAKNIAVASLADIMMLCTMAEGFYYRGRKLNTIHVEDIDKYLTYIDKTKSDTTKDGVRKGGMKTKLLAARAGVLEAQQQNRKMEVVIGHSKEDSRKLLEDNAGTWVVQ